MNDSRGINSFRHTAFGRWLAWLQTVRGHVMDVELLNLGQVVWLDLEHEWNKAREI